MYIIIVAVSICLLWTVENWKYHRTHCLCDFRICQRIQDLLLHILLSCCASRAILEGSEFWIFLICSFLSLKNNILRHSRLYSVYCVPYTYQISISSCLFSSFYFVSCNGYECNLSYEFQHHDDSWLNLENAFLICDLDPIKDLKHIHHSLQIEFHISWLWAFKIMKCSKLWLVTIQIK